MKKESIWTKCCKCCSRGRKINKVSVNQEPTNGEHNMLVESFDVIDLKDAKVDPYLSSGFGGTTESKIKEDLDAEALDNYSP